MIREWGGRQATAVIVNKKFLEQYLGDSKSNEKKTKVKAVFLHFKFDLVCFHSERKEQYTLNPLKTLQAAASLCPSALTLEYAAVWRFLTWPLCCIKL